MSLLRAWIAIPLWKRVLAALALGLLFAAVWPQGTPYVQFLGDLFVRAIRMLVVPIVLVTIAAGITTLGDPKRIGGIGGRTIALFAFTTAIAVSVGMLVSTLIRPGEGAPLGTAAPHAIGTPPTPYDEPPKSRRRITTHVTRWRTPWSGSAARRKPRSISTAWSRRSVRRSRIAAAPCRTTC